jgi:hypothetical protein
MAMTPFGATSSSGFWGGAGGPIAGGLIGLLGSAIQGAGTKTAAIQARKQAKEQSRYKMFGDYLASAEASAGRAQAQAMNIFGQLGTSLYGAPMDAALQEAEFALARKERELEEEQNQTPLFKQGLKDAAERNRLAERFTATLEDRARFGNFVLPSL